MIDPKATEGIDDPVEIGGILRRVGPRAQDRAAAAVDPTHVVDRR